MEYNQKDQEGGSFSGGGVSIMYPEDHSVAIEDLALKNADNGWNWGNPSWRDIDVI